MHKLEIKLKQHTPLIHFQHDQEGATLRASEVKPKLDKFVLTKLGNDDYHAGIDVAKNNGWLIGKGDHPALDYKIHIEASEKDMNVFLNINQKYDNRSHTAKYVTEDFPFLIANMGGKDSEGELMNLSLHNKVSMRIVTSRKDLCVCLNSFIDNFFAHSNFGQRQSKGFGSFSVTKMQMNDEEMRIIEWKNNFKDYFENGTPLMKFSLSPNNSTFEKQFMLFSVMDFYWRCLKSGINYSKRLAPRNGIGDVSVKYPERYIKAFLWTYLKSKEATWEKRKIKREFGLETPFPEREYLESARNAIFARGLMGCPDKYEYRIPQNTFIEDRNGRYKEVVENHTIEISNISGIIDRISSPIIFKPIIDGDSVYVYILFDHGLIEQLRRLPEVSRIFKFTEGCHQVQMPIVPEIFDYNELIKKYHYYMFTNNSFMNSTLGDYTGNRWQPAKIVITKDEQGKVTSRCWGTANMSWKMVPRNFKWENILAPSDNGQNHFVSFSQIVK